MTVIGNAFATLNTEKLIDLGLSKKEIVNLKQKVVPNKKQKKVLEDGSFLSSVKSLGNAEFSIPRIYKDLKKLPESGIPFRNSSINMPNGILNIFYFGNPGFLKKIKGGWTLKVNAKVTKKTIINNGKKQVFYNLDLKAIHPKSIVTKKIVTCDEETTRKNGVNLPSSQGGSIRLVSLNK